MEMIHHDPGGDRFWGQFWDQFWRPKTFSTRPLIISVGLTDLRPPRLQKGHGTRAKLSWRGLGINLKNHKNMSVPDGWLVHASQPCPKQRGSNRVESVCMLAYSQTLTWHFLFILAHLLNASILFEVNFTIFMPISKRMLKSLYLKDISILEHSEKFILVLKRKSISIWGDSL